MSDELRREIADLQEQLVSLRDQFSEEIRDLRWRLYHDRLTGLPNEAALYRQLDSEEVAWVVSIDLNGFKAAQDEAASHSRGNEILKAFAQFLRGITRHTGEREKDFIAFRPHGDEFVVVCRERGGAERIASSVMRWEYLGVTAAAGVGTTLDGADIEMYSAKKQMCESHQPRPASPVVS